MWDIHLCRTFKKYTTCVPHKKSKDDQILATFVQMMSRLGLTKKEKLTFLIVNLHLETFKKSVNILRIRGTIEMRLLFFSSEKW